MKNKISEFDMVNDCYAHIKQFYECKYVSLEVPFLSRCIDMVLITRNNNVISLEFKLKNISQAIKQARDHALGADYSFIVIPKKEKINLQLFKKNNLGLAFYQSEKLDKLETINIAPYNNPVRKFKEMLIENTIKVNS